MKILSTLVLVLFVISIDAQNFIDKHFPAYEDHEASTVVHVAARSFQLASVIIPEDEDEEIEIRDLVSSITALDVIAIDDLENAAAEYNRGLNILDKQYEALMSFKDKKSNISIYIDEQNDIVYEVVGIGLDQKELILISLTGEMALESVGKIINIINSKQKTPLDKIKDYNASSFSIYPNPIKSSNQLSIDIPDQMIGGKAYIYDIDGVIVSKFDLTEKALATNTDILRPGTYVVGIEKDDVVMKKQLVVVQ